ncbi:uncharacterized, partial [Tachysurus ichikawai]
IIEQQRWTPRREEFVAAPGGWSSVASPPASAPPVPPTHQLL